MSTPADFYHSLPPVSRAYGTICVLTTALCTFGLLSPGHLALEKDLVFRKLQLWRFLTNFFYLGPFSIPFGMQILMIARYSVQLERGPYDKRTADYVWMIILAMGAFDFIALFVPPLSYYFMGSSLVFMLVYLWSREFASTRVSIAGVVTLQGFYLPWALLALNTVFGASPWPDLLGIFVGHAYYFFSVLHPRQTGKNPLKTPFWVYPSSLFLMFCRRSKILRCLSVFCGVSLIKLQSQAGRKMESSRAPILHSCPRSCSKRGVRRQELQAEQRLTIVLTNTSKIGPSNGFGGRNMLPSFVLVD